MQRDRWKRGLAALVMAGLFAQAGWSQVPVGGEFQVNTYTRGGQYDPAVASTPDGRFVVVWMDTRHDGHYVGIFARGFDAAGMPAGASEFRVNSYTTGSQRRPAVSTDPTGHFIVAWESNNQDGDYTGIFAQRFVHDLIFRDGFD